MPTPETTKFLPVRVSEIIDALEREGKTASARELRFAFQRQPGRTLMCWVDTEPKAEVVSTNGHS